MNQPLLKDILFEKVENSYTLKEDLKHSAGNIDALLKIITEFVNQNYTPKTNEANPQL